MPNNDEVKKTLTKELKDRILADHQVNVIFKGAKLQLVAFGDNATTRIQTVEDILKEAFAEKTTVKYTIKLGDFTKQEAELRLLAMKLIKDDDLRKELKDNFNATYYIEGFDVTLTTTAANLEFVKHEFTSILQEMCSDC